jgi:RNA polymerase sigma-70 factor, ECF subfamily
VTSGTGTGKPDNGEAIPDEMSVPALCELPEVVETYAAGRASDVADEAALVAAAQRDPRDFGPLYELYVDRIYRYAYRRVGTHHEAEDITAQTFQQALQALPNYQWRGLPFGAWLFRIAGNIINRRGRTSGREVAVEDVTVFSGYEPTDDDPADHVWRNEQASELSSMITKLPPDQQRVLVLKFSHGLKNREIGDLMGRSEGAIKQLVHRALVALRASMDRTYA